MSKITLTEKVKKQKIHSMLPKKIKGSVTIQLFNGKTGELEKEVKAENMTTNALATIFNSNYFGSMQAMQLMPLATHMYGGLLCFEHTNTEDPENFYVPNDNPIIAHAGQSNENYTTQNDSTRGTVNGTESGVIAGGYRHVWNFETTQGNGRISSLSLTHKDFGDYAFHDVYTIDGEERKLFSPFEEFIYNASNNVRDNRYIGSLGNVQTRAPLFYDLVDNTAYRFYSVDNTTLRITELKSYGIIDNIGLTQIRPNEPMEDSSFVITHTLTMPNKPHQMRYLMRKITAPDYDDTATYSEGDRVYYNGKLYKAKDDIDTPEAFTKEHWNEQICYDLHAIYPNGSTVTRRIINLSNWTVTASNFTVPDANMLPDVNNSNPEGECYPVLLDQEDNMYVCGANSKVYKFNYSNPTQVRAITIPTYDQSTTEMLRGALHGIGHCGVSAAVGLIIVGETAYPCDNPNTFQYRWNTWSHSRWCEIDNQLVIFAPLNDISASYTSSGISSILNKMYLATIFNLSTPVDKNATQSMKVIYEITEIEEEEENE